MSDDPGYRPGGTAGGRCGCAAATLPFFLAAPPVLIISAIGNCASDPSCERGRPWLVAGQFAAIVAMAALLGFGVRALVNWWALRRCDPRGAGLPPLWAIMAVLAVAGAIAWLLGETWF